MYNRLFSRQALEYDEFSMFFNLFDQSDLSYR